MVLLKTPMLPHRTLNVAKSQSIVPPWVPTSWHGEVYFRIGQGELHKCVQAKGWFDGVSTPSGVLCKMPLCLSPPGCLAAVQTLLRWSSLFWCGSNRTNKFAQVRFSFNLCNIKKWPIFARGVFGRGVFGAVPEVTRQCLTKSSLHARLLPTVDVHSGHRMSSVLNRPYTFSWIAEVSKAGLVVKWVSVCLHNDPFCVSGMTGMWCHSI